MHGLSCHMSVDCKAVKEEREREKNIFISPAEEEIHGCVEQCYASSLFANRDEPVLFTAA